MWGLKTNVSLWRWNLKMSEFRSPCNWYYWLVCVRGEVLTDRSILIMSSTTSSDRLALLSYTTFNYHIPIHDHSDSTWRQHQWKQAERMIALAFGLTEWSSLEGQFGIHMILTYFVCSWRSRTKRSYWILSKTFRELYRFFSGIFPFKIKFNHSDLGSNGGRLWQLKPYTLLPNNSKPS